MIRVMDGDVCMSPKGHWVSSVMQRFLTSLIKHADNDQAFTNVSSLNSDILPLKAMELASWGHRFFN